MPDYYANRLPEGFKTIPGYTYYAIDKSGEVLSFNYRWAPINSRQRTAGGCYHVRLQDHDTKDGLYADREYREIRVCALVLLTFKDEPLQKGGKILHLDGDSSNNQLTNLKYFGGPKPAFTLKGSVTKGYATARKAALKLYTSAQLVEAHTKLEGYGLSLGQVSRMTGITEEHLRTLFWVD